MKVSRESFKRLQHFKTLEMSPFAPSDQKSFTKKEKNLCTTGLRWPNVASSVRQRIKDEYAAVVVLCISC